MYSGPKPTFRHEFVFRKDLITGYWPQEREWSEFFAPIVDRMGEIPEEDAGYICDGFQLRKKDTGKDTEVSRLITPWELEFNNYGTTISLRKLPSILEKAVTQRPGKYNRILKERISEIYKITGPEAVKRVKEELNRDEGVEISFDLKDNYGFEISQLTHQQIREFNYGLLNQQGFVIFPELMGDHTVYLPRTLKQASMEKFEENIAGVEDYYKSIVKLEEHEVPEVRKNFLRDVKNRVLSLVGYK